VLLHLPRHRVRLLNLPRKLLLQHLLLLPRLLVSLPRLLLRKLLSLLPLLELVLELLLVGLRHLQRLRLTPRKHRLYQLVHIALRLLPR